MSLTFGLVTNRDRNSPLGISVPRLTNTTHPDGYVRLHTTGWSGDRNSREPLFGEFLAPSEKPLYAPRTCVQFPTYFFKTIPN